MQCVENYARPSGGMVDNYGTGSNCNVITRLSPFEAL